jgi:hypothetical protein
MSASLSESCFSQPHIGRPLLITDIGRVDPDSVSTMSLTTGMGSANVDASGKDI